MGISSVLILILFGLMAGIGGVRGIKAFFTLFFNYVIIFIALILIALNVDPIKVTAFVCITVSTITLFYTNGFNKKTVSSTLAVVITVLITMLITYKIGSNARIQGLSPEEAEGISFLSMNTNLDFTRIFICQVLLGLLGAIIDVSITVSSSMNEIIENNAGISKVSLFRSGLNIGKDILGTMTNTLLFAYISGFMTLIIYFYCQKYTIEDIINRKVFCSEIFQILCSGIGIVIIIPVTALIASRILFMKPHKRISKETEGLQDLPS